MKVEGGLMSAETGQTRDKENWKWIQLVEIGLVQVGMGQLFEAVQ